MSMYFMHKRVADLVIIDTKAELSVMTRLLYCESLFIISDV